MGSTRAPDGDRSLNSSASQGRDWRPGPALTASRLCYAPVQAVEDVAVLLVAPILTVSLYVVPVFA